MPEVSTIQAAQIIGASHNTIWKKVRAGDLPARRQGERGLIRIEIDDLRRFAQDNGYRFYDEIANSFTAEK